MSDIPPSDLRYWKALYEYEKSRLVSLADRVWPYVYEDYCGAKTSTETMQILEEIAQLTGRLVK